MRNISASLTAVQILNSVAAIAAGLPPIKDVTRRQNWLKLAVGDRLRVCLKCMGLKPGEHVEHLATVEVVSTRRERLNEMLKPYRCPSCRQRESIQGRHHHLYTDCSRVVSIEDNYGPNECRREGFALKTPAEFVEFFCRTHSGCNGATVITRIEFKYLLCSFGACAKAILNKPLPNNPYPAGRCVQPPVWQSTFDGKPNAMFWCQEHGTDLINGLQTPKHGLIKL